MSNQLHAIEHCLKALRYINPMSLDIEDRIEYYQALIEVLKEKMYFYTRSGDYKYSVEIQYEVVEKEKLVDWLIPFLAKYKPTLEIDNKYLKYARGEFDLQKFVEAKTLINTTFFGSGIEVDSVGNKFILTPKIESINIDKEIERFKKICKEEGYKFEKLKNNQMSVTIGPKVE